MTYPTYTLAELEATDACASQVSLFRKLFGSEVILDPEVLAPHLTAFNVDWKPEAFLDGPALTEYSKARVLALAEYWKVHGPAWAEYRKVTNHAWDEYEKAKDHAWAEYRKVRDHAWDEYQKVRGLASAEYKKARGLAFLDALIATQNRRPQKS